VYCVSLTARPNTGRSIIIAATTIATTTHYDTAFHDRNKVIGERSASQCPASDEELLSKDCRASSETGGAAAGSGGAAAGAGGASSSSDELVALLVLFSTPIHASMSNAIPESANRCSHSLVVAFRSFSTPRCMAMAFVFSGLYE